MHSWIENWRIDPVLVWMVATAHLAGCTPLMSTDCRHSDECPPGQFCRLGECETRDSSGRESPNSPGGSAPRSGPDLDSESDVSNDTESNRDAGSPPNCPTGERPAPDQIALNEILPNVPDGPQGDTNGDGERDAFDDEFVELVNRGDRTLDLAGVQLVESGDVVTTLPSICLKPNRGLLIFGGIAEGVSPVSPEGVEVRVSSKRLGFSNSGGSFRLVGPGGTDLASVEWNSAPPTSYTLDPQIDGSEYVPHTELAEEAALSPGHCAEGAPLAETCTVAEPDTGVPSPDGANSDAGGGS